MKLYYSFTLLAMFLYGSSFILVDIGRLFMEETVELSSLIRVVVSIMVGVFTTTWIFMRVYSKWALGKDYISIYKLKPLVIDITQAMAFWSFMSLVISGINRLAMYFLVDGSAFNLYGLMLLFYASVVIFLNIVYLRYIKHFNSEGRKRK